ncbi:prolyl-tRNA synthetase associated domain-containing protein [Aestuariivirga litoralis]|uniref:prolyl-tRNA synthetase associated domain-containing protein n=1 Tax=Aestuariivirga litoralis TaxID=2650924 RepID=UPI0018C7DE3A|nr:prolyl-tRNA synthetase associated domain-containing protein [Aestuariivirga litoralis]MBG1233748.1 prolyl-tRNA synthetase associated domain-containing protein [Aestuariivirga litoralis]
MPATRQDLFALFDQQGIKTTTTEHIPVFTVEEARKVHDGMEGGHCKNLFCKDEKGALWLIVALEDAKIDLKAAKDKIGSKRLTFGKPELLMEILGVEPGSVTPFGLINDKAALTNVILDEAMMRHAKLNYHPLKNDATTTISADDLQKFIRATGHNPRIVAVSEPA